MNFRSLPVILGLSLAGLSACGGETSDLSEVDRWEERASRVTIIRDDWGIPHVYGPTDADVVFGLLYAQAEDDFQRVEMNYINSQGRLAEWAGEDEVWRDLRMKLFIDPVEMQALYEESPQWLKDLMDGFADGLNYYLHTHPEVEPKVIDRFEPWMALTFSEGSIGGDIERVNLRRLAEFYGPQVGIESAQAGDDDTGRRLAEGDVRYAADLTQYPEEPTGSNGFAIAPSNTVDGNALLLINPHTSFYFRAELHGVSEEGLDAYGASTWGQFFIYQGFNENVGWMHTSTGADNIDEYAETIVERDGEYFYQYGDEERALTTEEIRIPFRDGDAMSEHVFTVYRTHHGPVVREADGSWITVRLMEDPMNALHQSYIRTKATNYDEFLEPMRLHTNSSNNTVYADKDGNIAYFHSNFIPVRDDSFNWLEPVDGSDPATEWQGVHTVEETVGAFNPPNGWIQNTNNWPFSVIGEGSPRQEDYPRYMDRYSENARGIHAIQVLEGRTDFTLDGLIDAAYDSYLPAFEPLVPALVRAFDGLGAGDPRRAQFGAPVEALRGWDLRFGVESVPTSVAIFWGNEVMAEAGREARAAGRDVADYIANVASADLLLGTLGQALETLEEDFGTWETPWGEINRFQRVTGDIVQPFDDDQPSVPVGFTSARWGSLAAYGQRTFNDTKRIYGTRGNSFVAVVEFGDRVKARAISAGGQSGDPASPHFDDQIERYATGDLREVRFYREDIEAHAEETYHPGQRNR